MSKFKLGLFATLLGFSVNVFSQENSPLIGAWKMIKLEASVGGKMVEVPYTGQLIITDSHTLSAQAMDLNENAAPTAFTMGGYEALYGSIDIDDHLSQFDVTVESSLVRNLIGRKLQRKFSITGSTMVLSPLDDKEGWRVTYKRY
ncbi:hypothetical protein C4K68_09435 [Pokkaliibacter plantistimulans]|uniref:Uncharacterized protein n=1 Tax=Proteobacteria bacterium 228 TaxID=2083153 RepID=A0A2S5KSC3_9PROT|nr:lipocalin-like domain-containing protein [Pokkaliibacter plantistimulans]PPC77572.1 hypothetical protein C4K68_09435 [Pokkaliibacter plantistimulans]